MAEFSQHVDQSNGLKSVKKTFRIIQKIDEMGEARVSELADELGIHKSTISVHLQTLEQCDYVVRTDEGYRLSFRFLTHGARLRDEYQVFHRSQKHINALSANTGECATLSVREKYKGIPIYRVLGQNAVYDFTPIGVYADLHSTAFGKAILAALPADVVDDILDRVELSRFTEHTITSREDLSEELADVRRQGYALDKEEQRLGIWCIGKAITIDDRPIGAISLSGPTSRFNDPDYQQELVDTLSEHVNVVELDINYKK